MHPDFRAINLEINKKACAVGREVLDHFSTQWEIWVDGKHVYSPSNYTEIIKSIDESPSIWKQSLNTFTGCQSADEFLIRASNFDKTLGPNNRGYLLGPNGEDRQSSDDGVFKAAINGLNSINYMLKNAINQRFIARVKKAFQESCDRSNCTDYVIAQFSRAGNKSNLINLQDTSFLIEMLNFVAASSVGDHLEDFHRIVDAAAKNGNDIAKSIRQYSSTGFLNIKVSSCIDALTAQADKYFLQSMITKLETESPSVVTRSGSVSVNRKRISI